MIFYIYFFILQIFISLQVLAESVTPTFLQGCVLLQNQKIYCFGGATGSVDIYNSFQPTNQFISLNIANPLTFDGAKNNWEKMTPPTNYDLEPRAEFVSAAVNDSKKWIIESGAGKGNQYLESTLTNITICFDTETNQWTTFHPNVTSNQSTYAPAVYQMHGASSATFQNTVSSAVITFGGFRMGNNPVDLRNTSVYSLTHTSKGKNWLEVDVDGFETPGTERRSFRSQIVIINETLYTIGGFSYNLTLNTMDTSTKDTIEKNTNASFGLTSFKYSLTNDTGGTIFNPESIFPSDRFWHTFTHVPDTNNILLYGGIAQDGVCGDYFYKFDTVTSGWDLITFDNGVGPGKRYGHSAIINGNILYILFGADGTHTLQNDVHMLNLTNMNWIEPIVNSLSSSLSSGAIAGISIASIVVASLLIGAIVFYIIRKKRIRGYQPPEKPAFLNDNTFIKNNDDNDNDDDDNDDDDNDDDEISSYVNNNNNNSSDNNLLYPKPTLASNHQDEIHYRELGIKPNDSDKLLNQTYTTYPGKPGIYDYQQDIAYHRVTGVKPYMEDHNHPSINGGKASSSSSNHSIVLQLKQPEHSVKPTLD